MEKVERKGGWEKGEEIRLGEGRIDMVGRKKAG